MREREREKGGEGREKRKGLNKKSQDNKFNKFAAARSVYKNPFLLAMENRKLN
jgi:hypothetical protein